ncbi:MAG: hypothetical protein GIX03_03175 [Candidatus Eremiobacteraeota bacterium]|nr:hypothetical protein [Candidatus Eremiobacteraeota bacterium]MBC5802015.1 hypothetical protein [Candidatus Eremiobacteraeota bacterium]MBC5822581.1 hypothetical protein [Candidatus Eremiobacteraeota bacterium]
MVPLVFVTLAAVTLSCTTPPHRHQRHHAPALIGPLAADPNLLYSARARKRMVAYLKLRLLELREQHLERAAAAIERRLPVSELLKGP